MVIDLSPELEGALRAEAERRGLTPEALARETLRMRFPAPIVPRDDWERRVLALGKDYGVSLPPSALTSEEMY